MTEDRRARKKRQTQHALRLAALRLVDAHGLEQVTVEMISDAADVSPRTFFNHFPTKEAALIGPAAEEAGELDLFWADRPAGESPVATLRRLVLARTSLLTQHSEEIDLQLRVLASNPSLYGRFCATFTEIERVMCEQVARQCGLDPERDLYPRLLAAVAGAAIRSSMDLWRAGDERELASIVDAAFTLCAAGFETPPAPHRPSERARRRAPSPVFKRVRAHTP